MTLHPPSILHRSLSVAILLLLVLAIHPALTQTTILIDASRSAPDPPPARYDIDSATSPTGQTLGLNSRYLTLNGQPWLPVMGEFHFSRYPADRWEEELLKMKAAGVNIVATYVIWIHHEEIEGQFNWSGQRDLRAFAQLCARHGMYLVVRIGPWAHGEVRNGGFPDWLVQKVPTRRSNPLYLNYVRAWYAQIAQQVAGQLWKDGGPILAVQLENEYSARGPDAGEAHILELKKIARDSGLLVPFYFVTGWDNAVVPERAVLPVYDGYPDAPWADSITAWPPAEVYAFRLHSRVAANIPPGADSTTTDPVPFLTAEMGGGNEVTYHRRPILQPDDIAAILPVMLGSGVNLYGVYMFQGGENPDGLRTTLQESQSTGYPNDVPVKSYDFQAPLGEFGQERSSFRKLKVFNYFLNAYGADLAPMTVHPAPHQPDDPANLVPLRAVVRSAADHGFLFLNNYARNAAMPAHPAVQFEIRLPGSTLRIPAHPMDIPSSAYCIWPFNLRANGVTLRYSTAQLFTRIDQAGILTLYFEAIPGIPAEFAIDANTAQLQAPTIAADQSDGVLYLRNIRPGLDSAINLVSATGHHIRLVTLTQSEAENAWKLPIDGEDRLFLTSQDIFWDSNRVWLRTRTQNSFSFTIAPPPATPPQASLPLQQASSTPAASAYTAAAAPIPWDLKYRLLQPAAAAPPVPLGPPRPPNSARVARAPAGPEFQHAAKWSISIPAGTAIGPQTAMSDLFLSVRYQGDAARLYGPSGLLTDDFYNGQPWSIGLGRFLNLAQPSQLELDILPLRADAPIFLEKAARPAFPAGAHPPSTQIDKLQDLTLHPEYQLILNTH